MVPGGRRYKAAFPTGDTRVGKGGRDPPDPHGYFLPGAALEMLACWVSGLRRGSQLQREEQWPGCPETWGWTFPLLSSASGRTAVAFCATVSPSLKGGSCSAWTLRSSLGSCNGIRVLIKLASPAPSFLSIADWNEEKVLVQQGSSSHGTTDVGKSPRNWLTLGRALSTAFPGHYLLISEPILSTSWWPRTGCPSPLSFDCYLLSA